MVNAAIIGCGDMGRVHAHCLAQLDRVRLLAFCDRELIKAVGMQQQYNAEMATDRCEKIFSADAVDLIYITTHTNSHKELCMKGIQSRKNMMIEKPVCLTAADSKEIWVAAQAAGVKAMVAMKFRFYEMVQKARTLIADPFMISVQVMDDPWPADFWANDPHIGGGHVISQGVHGADLLRYLAGAEPSTVFAVGGNYHQPTGVVDNLSAVFTFNNGLAGTLIIGDCGQPPQSGKFMIQIFGREGVVLLSERLTKLHYRNRQTGETVIFTGQENGFLEENRTLINMLHDETASVSSIWDGYMAQAMIEAAMDSAKSGAATLIRP